MSSHPHKFKFNLLTFVFETPQRLRHIFLAIEKVIFSFFFKLKLICISCCFFFNLHLETNILWTYLWNSSTTIRLVSFYIGLPCSESKVLHPNDTTFREIHSIFFFITIALSISIMKIMCMRAMHLIMIPSFGRLYLNS